MAADWRAAEDFDRWLAQLDGPSKDDALREARVAIDRVLDIHQPLDAVNYHGGGQRMTRVCTGCGTDNGNWQVYPCPTVRALGGGER